MDNTVAASVENRFGEWPTEKIPVVVFQGDTRDVIQALPDNSVQCVVTSPPYWGVRDYGVKDQLGAEPNLTDYITNLVVVFREVRRILTPDGVFWLNIIHQGGENGAMRMKKTKAGPCLIDLPRQMV